MSDNNPYSSPLVEAAQVESDLVVAKRSWAVHGVAVSSLALAVIGSLFTWAVISNHLELIESNSISKRIWVIQRTAIAAGIVFSATFTILGFGVWFRKPWARLFTILIASLSIVPVLILAGIFFSRISVDGILGLPMIPYDVCVLIILLQKKYKSEFS